MIIPLIPNADTVFLLHNVKQGEEQKALKV